MVLACSTYRAVIIAILVKTPSLTKALLLMSEIVRYEPKKIMWERFQQKSKSLSVLNLQRAKKRR